MACLRLPWVTSCPYVRCSDAAVVSKPAANDLSVVLCETVFSFLKLVVLSVPAHSQKKQGDSLPRRQHISVHLAAGVLPLCKPTAPVAAALRGECKERLPHTAAPRGVPRRGAPCQPSGTGRSLSPCAPRLLHLRLLAPALDRAGFSVYTANVSQWSSTVIRGVRSGEIPTRYGKGIKLWNWSFSTSIGGEFCH